MQHGNRGADGRGKQTWAGSGQAVTSTGQVDLHGLLSALARPWRLAEQLPLAVLNGVSPCTPLQVQVLHNRGISGPEAVRAFLDRDWHAEAPRLPGLDAAAERVRAAISAGEHIVVFGDFDADGITSCAVLVLALRALGAGVAAYIPSREDVGRGPSEASVRELAARGTQLLITTDNGTTNVDEIALANSLGMDVIVTDHHAPQAALAPAAVIVNPHLAAAGCPDAELAGAGVAFRLAETLLGASHPDTLESLLDLVALGTIGDMAVLSATNWTLVRAGLRQLNAHPRPGIGALLSQIGIAPGALDEGDIAYRIGPRLNAGQRMGEPRLALDLLLTDDPAEAERLAARLCQLNSERQRRTDELVDEARAQILARPLDPSAPLVVAQGRGWPFGLLGLVAGRLADAFHRPAVVISREGETCRGSVRGRDGVSVIAALGARADLLAHFGGHDRAAGFTVSAAHLDELLRHLRAYLAAAPGSTSPPGETTPADLLVDCRLHFTSVLPEKYQALRQLGPFGVGFAAPHFLTRSVRVVRCFATGPQRRHLRLVLHDGTAERVASWLGKGEYAEALTRARSALPPLDVVYRIEPFYTGSGQLEYVSVAALAPSPE